jgi:rubrerythrin
MFGEDLDRNTILQEAKISAEALVLKRTILLNTKTSQPTLTVFEQAEKIKQIHISKLQTDMDTTYAEAQESTAEMEGGSSDYEDLMQKYWDINQYREKLKNDIFQADYSEEELRQAEQRIEKIRQIENRGKSESEDLTSQMKEIWKQLVQSLLLLKCKTQGTSPTTFKNTPSASKDPIGRIARDERGNLNRLELEEGELIRAFSLRCRHEQRYCAWLRALHAPPPLY